MKFRQPRPILVTIVSDLHINSTVGLVHPDYVGTENRTATQKWIWHEWAAFWDRRRAQIKEHKARHFVVLNGDLVEGRHHGIKEIVTPDEEQQLEMAIKILEPIAKTADRFFITRGTTVHDGSWCEVIGSDLGAEQTPDGKHCWWLLRSEWNGVQFNIAHPRRQAFLPWTVGGPENRLHAEIRYKYAVDNDGVPDIVIRSHGHRSGRSSAERPLVIFTPAWKTAGEYVRNRIDPDSLADVGGVWFLLKDGAYTWDFDNVTEARQPLWKE